MKIIKNKKINESVGDSVYDSLLISVKNMQKIIENYDKCLSEVSRFFENMEVGFSYKNPIENLHKRFKNYYTSVKNSAAGCGFKFPDMKKTINYADVKKEIDDLGV